MGIQQPTYIIAVVFSSLALFVVWLAYKFLVPIFYMTVSPLATQYPAMVGNDPTYVNGFNQILTNTNILFQYDFVIMGLGIVGVFVIIIAYRKVFSDVGSGYQEEAL